ncbi:MAG TPA: ribosome maturation factor RimM [Zeimonas sp.]
MVTRPGKRPPPELPRERSRPTRPLPAQGQRAERQRADRLHVEADLPSAPAAPVVVGRITGAWGVRGWVRVAPFNDPRLSLLLRLPVWWLRTGSVPSRADPVVRSVRIEGAKPHGGEIVAKLAGIDDRDAALALEGCEVLLSREQFPEPEADEVYWTDLIGCRVLDPDDQLLGTVVAIDDQPAHPVMRLTDGEARPGDAMPGGERLIPLVPELILSIDLVARVVVADWRRDY